MIYVDFVWILVSEDNGKENPERTNIKNMLLVVMVIN